MSHLPSTETDFQSQSVVTVTLLPGGPQSINTPVGLVDDLIQETQEGFLLVLELVDSLDSSKVTFGRGVSLARIDDNDGMITYSIMV